MRPIVCIGVALLCLTKSLNAQNVGIGNTSPHASARLDITATDKGILIPRMDSTMRKAIASPAEGLLVMDTSIYALHQYRQGVWQVLHADGFIPLTQAGGSLTWDYTLGNIASVTLTANATLTIQHLPQAVTGVLTIKQDGTGGRTLNLPAGSLYPGGSITLSTAPNSTDLLTFLYLNGKYYWIIKYNYY